MEGPSLVILTEELKPYIRKKVRIAEGGAKLDFRALSKATLKKVLSWGKHLILVFDSGIFRVHFLMFGTYRVNEAKKDRIPKLRLEFDNGFVNFYACAIRPLEKSELEAYDWSLDLMSEEWDERRVVKLFRAKKDEMICDVLMDQTIFPGLGNIMKNETIYIRKLLPEMRVGELTSREQLALVRAAHEYSWQFYEWKKINQLKRNWKVFRRRVCAQCGGKVLYKKTGKLDRASYICEDCQGEFI